MPDLSKITSTWISLQFALMKARIAIKTDLFTDEHHRKKIDSLFDPRAYGAPPSQGDDADPM